jgi:hypothetical protein
MIKAILNYPNRYITIHKMVSCGFSPQDINDSRYLSVNSNSITAVIGKINEIEFKSVAGKNRYTWKLILQMKNLKRQF